MASRLWWSDSPGERYWLEFTDRGDLGQDLRAPLYDESGKDNWRYTLFKCAAPGDVVYHYHKPQDAIVAVSRVAGQWKDGAVTWGARGTFAREKGVRPHERAGYVVPLKDFSKLAAPLALVELREREPELRQIVDGLKRLHPKQALYFPFELGRRPVRGLQGYAFKLPRAFVDAFLSNQEIDVETELAAVGHNITPARSGGQGFASSPEVRRAIERHAMQAAEAHFVGLGFEVKDVSAVKPFDLLASKGSESLFVEVKGTTTDALTVFLTRNEVEFARTHATAAVLFIVHGIGLSEEAGILVASGGQHRVFYPWAIESGELQALTYRYSPPATANPPLG